MMDNRLKVDATSLINMAIIAEIVYVFVPAFQYVIPQMVRYLFLAVIYFFPILALLISNNRGRGIITLFFATLCVLLYYTNNRSFSSTQSFGAYFLSAFMFWNPFLMSIVITGEDKTRYRKIYNFYLIIMAITVATTIIGNISFPLSSRLLAGSDSDGVSVMYKMMNIGGYGFIYGSVISIPMLWYKMRHAKNWIFYLLLIIEIYVMVFLSQYAIAIYLSILLIALLIVFRSSHPWRSIAIICLMVVAVVVFSEDISFWLKNFAQLMRKNNLSIISVKIDELANYLLHGETGIDSQSRLSLYGISITSFFESPIWGNLFHYHNLGGHSEYLDLLAGSGIIGMIIYLLAIKYPFQKVIRSFMEGEKEKRFIVVSIITFSIIALFDTVFLAPEVAFSIVIVPLLVKASIGVIKE